MRFKLAIVEYLADYWYVRCSVRKAMDDRCDADADGERGVIGRASVRPRDSAPSSTPPRAADRSVQSQSRASRLSASLTTAATCDATEQARSSADSADVSAWGGRRRPSWPLRHAYITTSGLVALATVIGLAVIDVLHPPNVEIVYLLVVLGCALTWGVRPALFAAITSAVAFDYCFIPPTFSFHVSDVPYFVTLFGLTVAGIVASTLAARSRDQTARARRHEAETAALYSLSRSLATMTSSEAMCHTIVETVARTFGRATILLTQHQGRIGPEQASVTEDGMSKDPDRLAAIWAFEHHEAAGAETPNWSNSTKLYLPLVASTQIVGVLGIVPTWRKPFPPPERRLLDAFVNQSAMALERSLLAEQARDAAVLEGTHKLQRALLDSISHNLRTPLTTIAGALSSLSDDRDKLSSSDRETLLEAARQETERLNRLVGQVLDATRLRAGALRLHIEPCDVEDLIGVVLNDMRGAAATRSISIEVPPDFPLVPMDFALIEQVVANVLDNALKYSPPGSPVYVAAQLHEHEVEITVRDEGAGIDDADVGRVFEEFFRGDRASDRPGIGLGLSICKGFVEAHGGRIYAQRVPAGGMMFAFTLPLSARSAMLTE